MVSEDLPMPCMGGLARHVLALSAALIAEGHQVDLMGDPSLSDVLAVDAWARQAVREAAALVAA